MLILEGPSLRLACDRCHKRKQRCTRTGISDNKPCERCREAGAHCVYSPPSRLGRPSNKSKRDRERNNSVAQQSNLISSAKSLPSSSSSSSSSSTTTTTTTSPPPSSSPSSSPSCMPTAAQSIPNTRRSRSTATAASLGVAASSPSASSQFSEGASSPSSYHFGSPSLHTLDAVGGPAPFQRAPIPRSQPRQYDEVTIARSLSMTPQDHNVGTLPGVPRQQNWGIMHHNNNNDILGPEAYSNSTTLIDGHQQQQHLYNGELWPNVLATHSALQLQQNGQGPPRILDPNAPEHARWKWGSNPAEDATLAMNMATPLTMNADGSQQWYYYW